MHTWRLWRMPSQYLLTPALAVCLIAACEGQVTPPPESTSAASFSELPPEVLDSLGAPPQTFAALSSPVMTMQAGGSVQMTVLERNAAWWHSLELASPEQRLLQGPGYLWAGTEFEVGPYGAGSELSLVLRSYNPRPPHQFFSIAQAIVTGSYPVWTVSFEDGADGDFDDIIIRVEAKPSQGLVVLKKATEGMVRPERLGQHTLAIDVMVLDGPAGQPMPNRTVTLALEAVEGSAGHEHTGGKPAGTLSAMSVNTGTSGVNRVTYRAPQVSGPVIIRGTSDDAQPAEDSIQVGVEGLVSLPAGTTYGLIGSVPGRHTDGHYGTPALNAALLALADSFHTRFNTILEYNDMSLALGGLFDLNGNWTAGGGHNEHRLGTNVDLRTRDHSPARLRYIQLRWEDMGGNVHDETGTSAPHYHLRY